MATQVFNDDISPSQPPVQPTPNQPITANFPPSPLKAPQVHADNREVAELERQVRDKYFGDLEMRLHKMVILSKSNNDFKTTHNLVSDIKSALSEGIYDVVRTDLPNKRPRAGRKTRKVKNRK